MAAARVKGAQGTDYSAPNKVVTSVKHFVAYGQPEGGRDYNTTDMSESTLRNLYLPPFKAAIDAGVRHGDVLVQRDQRRPGLRQPVHRDRHPQEGVGLRRLHRERLHRRRRDPRLPAGQARTRGPCGHGTAADGPEAGANALMAGTDSEMVSTNIRDYGAAAARAAPDHDERGSTTPYAGSCGSSSAPASSTTRTSTRPRPPTRPASSPPADRKAARDGRRQVDGAAEERRRTRCRSTRAKKTAVIGPLGDDQHDMLGPWWGRGEDDDAVSVLRRHQGPVARTRRSPRAARSSNDEPPDYDPGERLRRRRRLRRRGRRRPRRPTRSCSRSARPAR